MNLYRILVDAFDEEGPFFQNYYPYGNNEDEAVNEVMKLVEILQYTQIILSDIEQIFEHQLKKDECVKISGFKGYLEAIKYGYPLSERKKLDDDN